MKFSYFNNGRKRLGLTTISKGITSVLSTIAPRFSAFVGKNILMRPYGKRYYDNETITPEKEFNLLTSMGVAHINLFGSGNKVVIVNHGWADNSQSFHPMIIALVKQGYLVAAIDHIGHGKSTGNKSHLLSFIESLEILIDHFREERIIVEGVIGHSMGAIATLNLPFHLLENKKIILISSPIKFFELMFTKVEQVGISHKLLIRVLENISRIYGREWHQLTTENNRKKLALNMTFIHDKNDKYAPFTDIESFLKNEKNNLMTTEGLGHRKILGDTNVINNITQVLAS